jgi:hypothetical protein
MSARSSMARARASFIFQPPLMLVMGLACARWGAEQQQQQRQQQQAADCLVHMNGASQGSTGTASTAPPTSTRSQFQDPR